MAGFVKTRKGVPQVLAATGCSTMGPSSVLEKAPGDAIDQPQINAQAGAITIFSIAACARIY